MSIEIDLKRLKIVACLPQFHKEVSENLSSADVDYFTDYEQFRQFIFDMQMNFLPDTLAIEMDKEGKFMEILDAIHLNILLKGIIIILLSDEGNPFIASARKKRVHDIYIKPINYEHLAERINFLVRFKLIKPRMEDLYNNEITEYKIPFSKRLFDVFFSGMLLLFLMPLLIIIALLVEFGSKGKIIYTSKRVGTGYKIFDFYKFRSMSKDADMLIKNMSASNQYESDGGPENSTFIKFKDDPRVTRIGKFIRKTSIDELPQLFNILKGDMSTVGNRPLPLYEAEMLTSNEWASRFLAPAGLTGLWQVSKRGRKDMSERERKKLDNFYALKYSFWFDIKILLKTIPAIIQKEKV